MNEYKQLIYHLEKARIIGLDQGFDILVNGLIGELLLAKELGHTINTKGHGPDAFKDEKQYEYKITNKNKNSQTDWKFSSVTLKLIDKIENKYDKIYIALREGLKITDIWELHKKPLITNMEKVLINKNNKSKGLFIRINQLTTENSIKIK